MYCHPWHIKSRCQLEIEVSCPGEIASNSWCVEIEILILQAVQYPDASQTDNTTGQDFIIAADEKILFYIWGFTCTAAAFVSVSCRIGLAAYRAYGRRPCLFPGQAFRINSYLLHAEH